MLETQDIVARSALLLTAWRAMCDSAAFVLLCRGLQATDGLCADHVRWALSTEHDIDIDIEVGRVKQYIDTQGLVAQHGRHLIVASGNVCTAVWPSLFWSLALGYETTVKTAQGHSALVEHYRNALKVGAPALADRLHMLTAGKEDPKLHRALMQADVVTCYGSDATVAEVRAKLPATTRFVAHGHAQGMTIVDMTRPLDMNALARDVVAFDGRGCMTPVHIAVIGSARDATSVGCELETQLGRWQQIWPRGPLSQSEQAQETLWRDSAALEGELFDAGEYSVVLGTRRAGMLRNISVDAYPTLERVLSAWSASMSAIRSIGTNVPEPLAAQLELLPFQWHGRVAPIGGMQVAALDALFMSVDGQKPHSGLLKG